MFPSTSVLHLAVLGIVDPRHDAVVDLRDYRHKLLHKSGRSYGEC